MIRMKIVKWLAAGALAVAVVPAAGLARHASYIAATPISMSAIGPVTPLHAVHAPAKKLSVQKKVSHTLHGLRKHHLKLHTRA